MSKILPPFRQLRWKLTLSYTAVTVAVILSLEAVIALVISWLATKPLEERLYATMDQQAAAGKQAEKTDKMKLSLKEEFLSPHGRVVIGVFLAYAGWAAAKGNQGALRGGRRAEAIEVKSGGLRGGRRSSQDMLPAVHAWELGWSSCDR